MVDDVVVVVAVVIVVVVVVVLVGYASTVAAFDLLLFNSE